MWNYGIFIKLGFSSCVTYNFWSIKICLFIFSCWTYTRNKRASNTLISVPRTSFTLLKILEHLFFTLFQQISFFPTAMNLASTAVHASDPLQRTSPPTTQQSLDSTHEDTRVHSAPKTELSYRNFRAVYSGQAHGTWDDPEKSCSRFLRGSEITSSTTNATY